MVTALDVWNIFSSVTFTSKHLQSLNTTNKTQQPLLHDALVVCLIALPVSFKEKLKNQVKNEGDAVTLSCELSKTVDDVKWKKGSEILTAGEKYAMKQQGTLLELKMKDLKAEDSGEYSCVCGDQKTFASVMVNGMDS